MMGLGRLLRILLLGSWWATGAVAGADEDRGRLQGASGGDWTVVRDGMSDLRSSAFGASTYVVVSGDPYVTAPGEIWTSPDTFEWTKVENPDPLRRPLTAVAFGGGQFVAVGYDYYTYWVESVFLKSSDGVAWTFCGSVHPKLLTGVGWGAGRFVAVGEGGAIFTSTDACTWTSVPPVTGVTLNDVTYGAGQFLAIGIAGSATAVIVSPKGTSWQPNPGIPFGKFTSVTYAKDSFLAAGPGGIARSTDGITWSSVRSGSFADVTVAGSLLVAVGPNRIEASPDGITWTPAPVSIPPGVSLSDLNTVTAGPNGPLAGGESGTLVSFSATGLARWTNRTLPASRYLEGVAASPAGFCAVGSLEGLATSPDGVTWTNGAISETPIEGIAYGAGLHVAVARGDPILTSPDCESWTRRPPPGVDPFRLAAVAYGGDGFVAVGLRWMFPDWPVPAILISSDGVEWTEVDTGLPDNYGSLTAVGWGGGRWVAMGYQSTIPNQPGPQATAIVTSDDGVSWTPHPGGAAFLQGEYPWDIAWRNDVFVAVGGVVWTSFDGMTWSRQLEGAGLFDIAAGQDGFLAVGDTYIAGTIILRSTDGVVWVRERSPTEKPLLDVAFSSTLGRFAAVGPSVIALGP